VLWTLNTAQSQSQWLAIERLRVVLVLSPSFSSKFHLALLAALTHKTIQSSLTPTFNVPLLTVMKIIVKIKVSQTVDFSSELNSTML